MLAPQSKLQTAARELYTIHGILPVAASGKIPMGGVGWNALSLETRLLYFGTPACTGLGFQFGPVFHPYYGPCNFDGIDVDERDEQKKHAFLTMFRHLLGPKATQLVERWGRGPLLPIFTRGQHSRERYGTVQWLRNGKYALGWGAHADVGEYRWPQGDIFKIMPPLLDVGMVDACLLAACKHAGIAVAPEKSMLSDAPAITEEQISMLSDSDLERYQNELNTELRSIEDMPSKSGRGTRLHNLGLRFGALARHDKRFGSIVADALVRLPGDGSAGDVRDFTRGLDESKGFALQRDVAASQQRKSMLSALKPKGADAPGQELGDLMQEHIPALRWLVERYLPHVGTLSLIGKPKIGKSWIILELALSIAEGGKFWGEQCHPTGVLLYMLEDGKRRMKGRVAKLRPDGPKPQRTFRIRYGADGPFRVNPDGSGGLLADIRKHKHDYPDIGFVVIDMYKAIRGTAERGLDAYQATGQLVAPIAALAQELDITIMIVHHARKGKIDPDDVSDAASGSNAMAGATEGSWTIWRDANGARIVAEVRDSENFDLQLVKEEGAVLWNPLETATTPTLKGGAKERVFLEVKNAGCELSPTDVAQRLQMNSIIVTARLNELRNAGLLQQRQRGLYCVQNAMPRFEGVIVALMRSGIVKPVTPEVKAKYDPEGKYSLMLGETAATGFAFTEDVINAIEYAGFNNGKAALEVLDVHKLVHRRKGVVWFFGPEFEINRAQQPLPWALPKMPWEL